MSANFGAMPSRFSISIESESDRTVVHCRGMLTVDHAEELKTRVKAVLPTKLVQIDLAGVDYIDSAGLGALVSLYTSARSANCELKLINFNERIADVLHITNLLWVLT